MPTKRTAICIGVALVAPLASGAIAVAAGHVLWSRIDQPTLVAAYGDYRVDRLILFTNAGICVGAVALSVWRLPLRRRFASTVAATAALASLPAYVLVYLYAFDVVQWLGMGWSSSA